MLVKLNVYVEHVIKTNLKLKLCRTMGTTSKKQADDTTSSSARHKRSIREILADKDTDPDYATFCTKVLDGGYSDGSAIPEGYPSPCRSLDACTRSLISIAFLGGSDFK